METSKESPENGISEVNSPEDPAAMGAIRKFLFDRVFDVEEAPEVEDETPDADEEAEPEVVVPTFSEEELKAAREDSFAAGKAEGFNEAAAATEQQIAALLEKLSQQFDGLFKAQEAADAAILENAISVACAIARKVFPALNERGALTEIEQIAVMAMAKILEEPEVIIIVNPEIEAALNERLGTLVAQAGYKGEVKIIADEGIVPGDCRIEWNGGGANRDMDALWQEIDEIVERNLSGNPPAAPDSPPDSHKADPEEPSETDENDALKADTVKADTVKADTGEISGEVSGAPAEAATKQPAAPDQEPQPDSSDETPAPSGEEDTPTDQEDT